MVMSLKNCPMNCLRCKFNFCLAKKQKTRPKPRFFEENIRFLVDLSPLTH